MPKTYVLPYDERLFLLGLPLSGKSTLGQLLAERLGWPFFDLDLQVCKALGASSVAAVFARCGEKTFRHSEKQQLLSFLQRQPPFVLATGGGTPCYEGRMSQLRATGTTIYLQLFWQLMAKRVQNSPSSQRPLLTKRIPQNIDDLRLSYAPRLLYYEQADIHFSVSDEPVAAQVEKMFRLYMKRFS